MSLELTEHGDRTAWLAERVCERLGLTGVQAKSIAAAARTHDVGKQLLPEDLLLKPSSLTPKEHGIVRQHCAMGAWMLRQQVPDPASSDAVTVALLHHEWWNGHGYPFGLAKEEIPLAARIVAVADVFDALCSERPYKSAWPTALARDYIRNRSRIQFDPSCVDALHDIEPALINAQYSRSYLPGDATPFFMQSAGRAPAAAGRALVA